MRKSKDELQQGLQGGGPVSLHAYGTGLINSSLFSLSKSLFSHPPPPRPSSCQHLTTTKEKTGSMSAVQDGDVQRGQIGLLKLTQYINTHPHPVCATVYLCLSCFLFSLPHFLSHYPLSLSENVGQQLSLRHFWSLVEPHQQQLPKDGASKKAKTRVPTVNVNMNPSLSAKVVLPLVYVPVGPVGNPSTKKMHSHG